MTGAEVLIGLFLANALGKSKSTPAPPPPPPPDKGGKGGGVDAGKLGALGGSLLSAGLGLLGGGGGGGGASAGAGVTGASTVSLGTAEVTTESVALVSVTESLTLGGAFALGWLVYFFLQFVVMNELDGLRNGWLRWRDAAYDLNVPFHHLQKLELHIIEATCKQLGLQFVATNADDRSVVYPNGYHSSLSDGTDPRLEILLRNIDATSAPHYFPKFREIVANPFPANESKRDAKWLFLQMSARLVAARYVFDLGVFARSFIQGWFGQTAPGWADSALDVWNYPLVGGGQPLATYATTYDQLKALNIGIDDMLDAARLQALLHVAALVQQDPELYIPWDPRGYSAKLYGALGLDPVKHGITLAGVAWNFDVHRYKVPCSALFLDVERFARTQLPLQPFIVNDVPTPSALTCLVALP